MLILIHIRQCFIIGTCAILKMRFLKTTCSVIPENDSHLIAYEISFQAFNRNIHFIYRFANPLFPPGVAEDVDMTFHTLPSGDLNATAWTTFDGECQFVNLLYQTVPDEKFKAVYTIDEPFFTTGNRSRMYSFRATLNIMCSRSTVSTDQRKSSGMVDGYIVTGHMRFSSLSTSTHQAGSNGVMQRGTFGSTTAIV